MNSTSHCPPIERVLDDRAEVEVDVLAVAFSASISPGARMPIPGTVQGA